MVSYLLAIALGSALLLDSSFAQDFSPYADLGNRYYRVAIMQRLTVLAVAAALGFTVGFFLSPLLRRFRRLLLLLLAALLIGIAIFGPFEGLHVLLAVGAFFVALAIGRTIGRLRQMASDEPPPTSFGTARWATGDYLERMGMLDELSSFPKGIFLGNFHEGDRSDALLYNGPRHLLTVAPTRSGKGVSAIIPNLLTYQGSVFVIDPKGENALVTADRRGHGIQGMRQRVHLLDPWDIAASALGTKPSCFNPLDWITADDPDAAENAFLLADAMVPSASEGEARFWDEESKALLVGVILYVATAKREAGTRTLGRVRDILMLGEAELRDVLTLMFEHPNPIVSSTASRTASKDPKLRANVFAAVQSHTHFLDSPRIRKSLSTSDCQFEDLKKEKVSIYLILPADRLKTFDRWLRLLIQIAITVNARNIAQKPDKPVLFLLDEMPSLGRLAMVEQAYSLMAGFGMVLWGIVQDLSQLQGIYRDSWQTFVSNSGVIQYFGSRDKMTAEYFSSLCGVTTVRVTNLATAVNRAFSHARNFSSAFGIGSSSNSTGSTDSGGHSTTHSYNESQRQLAYPDELMVLRGDQQIVFIENLDPIRAEKIMWFESEPFRGLGLNLQLHAEPRRKLTASRVATPQRATAPSQESISSQTARLVGALAWIAGYFAVRFKWSFAPSLSVVSIYLAIALAASMIGYRLISPVQTLVDRISAPPRTPPPELVRDITKLTGENLQRQATVNTPNAPVRRAPTTTSNVQLPTGMQVNVIGNFQQGNLLTVQGIATNPAKEVWYYVTFSNGAGFMRDADLAVR